MVKNILLASFAFLLFLPVSGRLSAQDSAKIVILSPKVGEVIDLGEREYFDLFPQFKEFQSVTFIQTPGRDIHGYFVFSSKTGELRDTLVRYSEALLLMLAEKVNNYEELIAGSYSIGEKPATLEFADVKDKRLVEIVEQRAPRKTSKGAAEADQEHKPFTQTLDGAKGWKEDVFRFAKDEGKLEPEAQPFFGFGIGFATCTADFSAIDRAMTAIENKYRGKGYTMTVHKYVSNPSSLIYYNLQFRFSNAVTLMLNGAATLKEGVEYSTVSASLLMRFDPLKTDWFRPYIGGGAGGCHFAVSRDAHDRISPISSGGEYDYLKKMSVEGGNAGIHLTGGMQLELSSFFLFDFFAEQRYFKKVNATVAEEEIEMQLSAFAAGIRFTLFF